MANFNSLPYEIQRLILQYIDSTKQLGECRRISKIWDGPAECAMFSRQLHITQHNSRPMSMHLLKRPSRANLIKEIYFDCEHLPDFAVPLLRLAITPSIEKIASNHPFEDIRFYQTLVQIVQDSGMILQRLKSIPWPHWFDDTHYHTALLFKDSLEEMRIPPNEADRPHKISRDLGKFINLSKLLFDCVFDALPQVESIFRAAGNLREIDLHNCYFEEGNVWPNEERLHWMRQHVKINNNTIALRAFDDQSRSITLIEYFLFKYPNIQQFDYNAKGFDEMDFEEIRFNVEINRQACLLISKIPSYSMTLTRQYTWRTHYRLFSGYKNVFHLCYGDTELFGYYEEANEISSIVEQDGKRTTQFQFWSDAIFKEDFFDTHVTFLKDIGTFTTHLYMRIEDPDLQSGLFDTMKSRAFFKSLEVMNCLEEMKLVSANSLEPIELDLSPQYSKRRFDTLGFYSSHIQPAMFHTLDRFFHTISTLKLSCCPIKKDQTNTLCIHMPSTALGKLILTTEWEPTASPDLQDDFYDIIFLTQDTYLMINLQQGVTLYFKLEPLSSIVHQVSFVEYSSRPRFANAFSIYCQLLASIELDLGDIQATIDIQKYCKTLDIAFSELRV